MKAVMKRAARAVVEICCETATAALVGAALVVEAADADADADAAEVEVALVEAEVADEAEESLEVLSTAVAFKVPHLWFCWQVLCPSASSGCAAIHWLKVSAQM